MIPQRIDKLLISEVRIKLINKDCQTVMKMADGNIMFFQDKINGRNFIKINHFIIRLFLYLPVLPGSRTDVKEHKLHIYNKHENIFLEKKLYLKKKKKISSFGLLIIYVASFPSVTRTGNTYKFYNL